MSLFSGLGGFGGCFRFPDLWKLEARCPRLGLGLACAAMGKRGGKQCRQSRKLARVCKQRQMLSDTSDADSDRAEQRLLNPEPRSRAYAWHQKDLCAANV